MTPCIVTVIFTVKQEHEAAFLEVVERNAKCSLEIEPGCRRFDVVRIEGRPNLILLYEIYDDDEAFAAHQQTQHFLEFDQISGSMVEKKESFVGRWTASRPVPIDLV